MEQMLKEKQRWRRPWRLEKEKGDGGREQLSFGLPVLRHVSDFVGMISLDNFIPAPSFSLEFFK